MYHCVRSIHYNRQVLASCALRAVHAMAPCERDALSRLKLLKRAGTAYLSTCMQGCLSVANILLGAGLLSIPYAMTLSGFSGVLVVALCCLLFNTSGKFISWGLDLLPPGIAHGYLELGYAAFGASGRHMVTLAAGLELFGGACMELLIFWRSIQVRNCRTYRNQEDMISNQLRIGTTLPAATCRNRTVRPQQDKSCETYISNRLVQFLR